MIGRLASVGGFTALSRVAGFFRDVLMAAVLGAGPASDAFMVAFRLPNNFRAIFAEGAFSAAFLPRYAAAAAKDGKGAGTPAAKFAPVTEIGAGVSIPMTNEEIAGTPPLPGADMRNKPGGDVPPPGDGLVTVTSMVPA